MPTGCFLACFGFSKKRKRRKLSRKILSADQGHGSYKLLDSEVRGKHDMKENHKTSNPEFSNKGKERSSSRKKKKVSFNLNVKTYEPLPNHDFAESEEKEEAGKSNNDSATSKNVSYSSNYRYYNCRDSFEDEEDDIKFEDSDPDGNDEESNADTDDATISKEEFLVQFCSLPIESEKRGTSADKKAKNFLPLSCSLDQELKKRGLTQRYRSDYAFSVLNPVENRAQWKAAKARAKPVQKQQRKENSALYQGEQIPICRKASHFNDIPETNHSKHLLQEFAVDASLSNWLCNSSS